MKSLFKPSVLLAMTFAVTTTTFAQEEKTEEPEKTFNISGSVDTYFRSSEYAPGSSFANLNGFALGMANVIFSYEGEKSSIPQGYGVGSSGALVASIYEQYAINRITCA